MNPRLKGVLETLRDALILSVCMAVLVSAFNVTMSFAAMRHIVVITFVYAAIIMLLAWQVFYRIHPLVANRGPEVQWTVFVVVAILISGVGSFLGSAVVSRSGLEPDMAFAELFAVSFKIATLMTLVIGVNEAVFDRLRGQLEDTKLKLQKEELERERATKLATEARLTALEARIHPHFLFNALNSISSLIPVDPKRAERLVERMAALLRFSFDAHRNGLVRFEQEMKIVRDYLEIEQARLGRRLKYNVDSGEELHEFRVPPFSVQTLVENSIKYAIAPSLEGGEIFVNAGRADGHLRVDVTDTGSGFEIDSVPEGHGLDNLRGRLAALFGGAAELSVHRAGDRTVVSLKVPA